MALCTKCKYLDFLAVSDKGIECDRSYYTIEDKVPFYKSYFEFTDEPIIYHKCGGKVRLIKWS